MNNIKNYLHNEKYIKAFAKSRELNKTTNFATDIYQETEFKSQNPTGPLGNVPFFIKDNCDFKGKVTTSGSLTLKDHVSLTTATIVEKLLKAGAIPVGKANLDEFAMGGTGLTSSLGRVVRDDKPEYIIGGSSSGSAVAVQSGVVPFAIGSDTGDSLRQPASWGNNIIGFKPTWGLISRYGVHAFSPAFDTLGYITKNVADQALLLSLTAGFDEKDFTSANVETKDYFKNLKANMKGKKVAIIKERNILFPQEYLDKFQVLLEKIQDAGVVVEEISIEQDFLKVIYPTYQSITFAEAVSQMASINGLSFSSIDIKNDIYEDVMQNRSELFTDLVQDRLTVGSGSILRENMEKVFIKAKKIRQVLINWCNDTFKNYDIILSPASTKPPRVSDSSTRTNIGAEYAANFFILWNMNGSPAITLPYEEVDGHDISVEIAANIFQDQKVLDFAYGLEKLIKGEEHE